MKKLFFFFILLLNSSAFAEDKIDPAIVNSQNAFAVKSFQAIYAQKERPNLFFAALDAGTFLRSLIPFVKKPHLETLLQVLETGKLTVEEIPNRSAGLWMISHNKEKEDIDYYAGMSLIGEYSIQFKPDFLARQKFYKIIPRSYDLKHPGMTASVEMWLKDSSKSKLWGITDYFDPEGPLNFFQGYYFKGRWSWEMETVSSGNFKNPEKEMSVPMLAVSGPFEFYKDDVFEAVSIPYGTGLYSLFIFMPAESVTLPDFIEKLNEKDLREWTSAFLERPGRVVFPFFSVSNNLDLRKNFKSMGLESFFAPPANFVAIGQAPFQIYLGSMEQKAVFEMDEKSVANPLQRVPEIDAGAQRDHFNFTASRPFFFMLRNNKTRVFSGLGVVEDPSVN